MITVMATNVFRKDISKINSKLSKHIGSIGEDAHGIASGGQAGFIDYETYDRALSFFGIRKYIQDNIDPATLDFGSYVGANIVNGPVFFNKYIEKGSLCMIDVQPYGGGKKRIILTYAYSAKTFIKTVHTNGATAGWEEFTTKKSLFLGSFEATKNSVLSFQNSVTAYSPSRLTVVGLTPSFNSFTEILSYERKMGTINRSNSYSNDYGYGLTSYELSISWNGDRLTVTDVLSIDQHNGNSLEAVSDSSWSITNIWAE